MAGEIMKTETKTKMAQRMILDYLKRLYEDNRNRNGISDEDKHHISSQDALIDHIIELYRIEKKEEYEKRTGEKADRDFEVPDPFSYETAKKALEKLMNGVDASVRKNGKFYEYVPPIDEQCKFFPFLRHREEIVITPVGVNAIEFFRTSPYYAAELADYINSNFYQDDVHAVAVGDIVICFEYDLPDSQKIDYENPKDNQYVEKSLSLKVRVLNVLAGFRIGKLEASKEIEGITYEEKMLSALQALERAQKEEEEQTGGIINNPVKRNIVKKHPEK